MVIQVLFFTIINIFLNHQFIMWDARVVCNKYNIAVKIVDSGLHFYFLFSFILILFSIFRTTQVRVYQSRCHISHKLMAKSQG